MNISSGNDANTTKKAVGVKRKFEEIDDGARKFKRQRKYRYMHTERDRGEKRKFPLDHTEQPRKRFKSSPENELEQHDDILSESTVKQSDSYTERDTKYQTDSSSCKSKIDEKGKSDIQPVPGTSGNSSNDKSRALDIDEADDNISCPSSCVCKAGHSKRPPPIRRFFECPAPLRRSLLMRLSYSSSNKRYTCCPSGCVRLLRRSEVRRTTLFHMMEDYDDQSDLRVYRYSWGEWKE